MKITINIGKGAFSNICKLNSKIENSKKQNKDLVEFEIIEQLLLTQLFDLIIKKVLKKAFRKQQDYSDIIDSYNSLSDSEENESTDDFESIDFSFLRETEEKDKTES